MNFLPTSDDQNIAITRGRSASQRQQSFKFALTEKMAPLTTPPQQPQRQTQPDDGDDGDGPVVVTEQVDLPNSGCRVVIVSINRPSRLNCFNADVVRLLSRAFAAIADEVDSLDVDAQPSGSDTAGQPPPLACVILTGRGRSFCVGADLSDPPDPIAQSSDLPRCLAGNPVHQMSRVGVPIIGAVRGHCITGGFELALACDFLVGDSTTRFRDTHVKFGLAPCWGLSQRLQRVVGPGRARYASLSACTIDAETALRWGLLTEVLDVDGMTPLDRAIEMADEIGMNDARMVRRYRRAMVEGGSMSPRDGLSRERELGLAHYVEAVGDGRTFEGAKEYITDGGRPRSRI